MKPAFRVVSSWAGVLAEISSLHVALVRDDFVGIAKTCARGDSATTTTQKRLAVFVSVTAARRFLCSRQRLSAISALCTCELMSIVGGSPCVFRDSGSPLFMHCDN